MYASGNYLVSRKHDVTTSRKFDRLMEDYLAKFRRLGRPRPRSVLDVGCFTGEFLDAAARTGLETFGFDKMTEAIAQIGERHRVWSGRLDHCPVSDQTFDLITLNDVLEHLSDAGESITFAADRLSPAGLLVMTTPDVGSWAGRLLGESWGVFDKHEHLVLFTRSAVQRLLDRCGLRVLNIKPHWKSLTAGYVWDMAWHWQAGRSAPFKLPLLVRNLPLRINVGEMAIVAARR